MLLVCKFGLFSCLKLLCAKELYVMSCHGLGLRVKNTWRLLSTVHKVLYCEAASCTSYCSSSVASQKSVNTLKKSACALWMSEDRLPWKEVIKPRSYHRQCIWRRQSKNLGWFNAPGRSPQNLHWCTATSLVCLLQPQCPWNWRLYDFPNRSLSWNP